MVKVNLVCPYCKEQGKIVHAIPEYIAKMTPWRAVTKCWECHKLFLFIDGTEEGYREDNIYAVQ